MAYSTISKPSLYFNTLLRTGNYAGSGTTAITGVGFAPGLMWEKKTKWNKYSCFVRPS